MITSLLCEFVYYNELLSKIFIRANTELFIHINWGHMIAISINCFACTPSIGLGPCPTINLIYL